tara:strand:+ start:61 stop:183 length:123 start_codon:yes stop_codon:yes gene_type:complete
MTAMEIMDGRPESAAIRVEAHRDDPEKLALILPDAVDLQQ